MVAVAVGGGGIEVEGVEKVGVAVVLFNQMFPLF
jgi:hypothetical protein